MKKNTKLAQAKFKVDGYTYRPVEKSGPDSGFNIKHYLLEESSGEIIEPDFTPWCYMSRVDVQNYLSLGKPGRYHEYRPLSSNDLRKMTSSINR